MPQTVPEFLDLLKALNANRVRYVVVGGLAMVFQGSTYTTFDLDFAISTDAETVAAVVQALAPFHPYPPRYGSARSFVWDARSFVGAVVELATEAGFVDILRVQPGVDSFEGLHERSEVRHVFDVAVRVASIDDLIAMKQAADRPKDRDHINQLRALKALRQPS
jgi:hypothetical protein